MADSSNNKAGSKKDKLGMILIHQGVITQQQLSEALDYQKGSSEKLGSVLVKLGFCSKNDIALALEKQTGIKYLPLSDYTYSSTLEAYIQPDLMSKFMVLPIKVEDNTLFVAMSDPLDFVVKENLRLASGMRIEPMLAHEDEIREIIFQKVGKKYATDELISDYLKTLDEEDDNVDLGQALKVEGLEAIDAGPVVRLVNTVISEAVESRASDIHIEPTDDEVVVRYRIDGILHKILSIPPKIQNPTVSRIKILSSMDIAERRKPQDGRMSSTIAGRDLDFRVSCLPTVHGEKIVMRILDKGNAMVGLAKLGLEDFEEKFIYDMAASPWGVFLVTGPTGCGKSTTLYSILNHLNSTAVNIITIEDPVEYTLKGINQVELNRKAGMDFNAALRSFLRQDPDVILVGEIRDYETLEAAIEASLTGHLVFSTLHTNDAPSAIVRMVQMGAPNYLVAASTIGIMAQRLVRKICPTCIEPAPYTDELRALVQTAFSFGKEFTPRLFKGKGCTICRGTGFKGRTGVFEMMKVSSAIRELVLQDASTDAIRKMAIKEGMRPLEHSALAKVTQGITTIEEAMRVTTLRKAETKDLTRYDLDEEDRQTAGSRGFLDEFSDGKLDEFPEEAMLDELPLERIEGLL
ncbi:Flp pilus assembly complex ATPase component TadA [bacterium]|nr:Flp pilus assembly complex ATPase component TadA [bacterium]MBU1025404.1 Flp pilus assembly complex ATPase component TadA [bacterium]